MNTSTDARAAVQPTRDSSRASSWIVLSMTLLMGIYFGIVLTKSEVVRWERIHKMFLFEEPNLYLIIGIGIVVAMVSMKALRAFGFKSIQGKSLDYQPKPFHKGIIAGGVLFGAGWAITGACPGPIYAQIGGGAWLALSTLAGALVGTFLYANLKPNFPIEAELELSTFRAERSPVAYRTRQKTGRRVDELGVKGNPSATTVKRLL